MSKEDNQYKKVLKALEPQPGRGHNIIYHLKEGSNAYKKIFLTLLKRLETKEQKTVAITTKQLYQITGLPSSACQYPLYKLEEAGLIRTSNRSRTKTIFIDPYMKKNWTDICNELT